MKIIKVEGTMVRDYKKLSRWDRNTVLIGTINYRHRTTIPIIGDGGPPLEGEDDFEVVQYSEENLKARKEAREKKYQEDRRTCGFAFPDDEEYFGLKVIPPSDDPRVLVNWRVFNCKKFEGKAEVLCEQDLAHTYREDDGCYDVSIKNTLECLAIFKPGDILRTVPIDPRGMYTNNVGGPFVPPYIYFMRWGTLYGKPHLSVTRKSVEAVEKRQQATLARKAQKVK